MFVGMVITWLVFWTELLFLLPHMPQSRLAYQTVFLFAALAFLTPLGLVHLLYANLLAREHPDEAVHLTVAAVLLPYLLSTTAAVMT